jgi:hypothetical protein
MCAPLLVFVRERREIAVQAPFKGIDVEMRCLVLQFNVARCHRLVEAERDPMKRQQYRRLLNASQYAEACFLREHGYPVPPHIGPKYSRDLLSLLALDEQRRSISNDGTSNVIDFQTAKHSLSPRKNSSRGMLQQWRLMSNDEKVRWLTMLRRTISRRLKLVESAQNEQIRHPVR